MKKYILIIAVLCTVQITNAQRVFSLHAVRVEGNTAAFEKAETEINAKVAQEAVNKGDILYWGLFKVNKFNSGFDSGEYQQPGRDDRGNLILWRWRRGRSRHRSLCHYERIPWAIVRL